MARRKLRFESFEDIVEDLENLEANGYIANGKWDLSQICEHLADWMSFPLDGFPKMPWFVACILGLLRVTQGKQLFEKIVKNRRMDVGGPTAPQTVHSPNLDAAASVTRLINAMQRLHAHRGDLHPSPLFGKLTHDELVALQLVHCAHHLSFLEPKSEKN